MKNCKLITFNHDWKYDLKVGNKGESEFSNLLRKERAFYTVECKKDLEMDDTGNLFVEVESRGAKSGIERTEADYFAFMSSDMSLSIVVKTEVLRKVLEAHKTDKVWGGDNKTSLGYLISAKQLVRSILQYVKP